MSQKSLAGLGLRAHSGWVAAVAVAGTPRAPEILERRRMVIADEAISGSVQPYHAAEEMPLAKARAYLRRCEAGSARLARRAVGALVRDLEAKGFTLAGCGLLLASGRELPGLSAILASHALIHTADGEHFRDALVKACGHAGLRIRRVRERDLPGEAAARFRMPETAISRLVAEAGKPIGPPWTADQKLAALAGWLALSGR